LRQVAACQRWRGYGYVAAMRSTMLEDPEEMVLYRTNLKLAMATARPMVDEAMRSYDD